MSHVQKKLDVSHQSRFVWGPPVKKMLNEMDIQLLSGISNNSKRLSISFFFISALQFGSSSKATVLRSHSYLLTRPDGR